MQHRSTFCNNCEKEMRIAVDMYRELGGQVYCKNCREEAPEGHPQKL